jgi:purine-binding chemotaxis protein CheW
MTRDLQIVGLRIGRETYGVPISLVREIVRVPEITAVPNAQKYVEGVINLRGKIISVIDLRKRFSEAEVETNKKNRIVVVELENRTVGLIVSAASEVLKIPPSDIEPPSSVFLNGEVGYVTGVGKLKNRLVILIDLNKVLSANELHHLEELNAPVEHLV